MIWIISKFHNTNISVNTLFKLFKEVNSDPVRVGFGKGFVLAGKLLISFLSHSCVV